MDEKLQYWLDFVNPTAPPKYWRKQRAFTGIKELMVNSWHSPGMRVGQSIIGALETHGDLTRIFENGALVGYRIADGDLFYMPDEKLLSLIDNLTEQYK